MSEQIYFNQLEGQIRKAAEARVMDWLRQRGLDRHGSVAVEDLPPLILEFSNFINRALQEMCNSYHKIAADALNSKLTPPFLIDEHAFGPSGPPVTGLFVDPDIFRYGNGDSGNS